MPKVEELDDEELEDDEEELELLLETTGGGMAYSCGAWKKLAVNDCCAKRLGKVLVEVKTPPEKVPLRPCDAPPKPIRCRPQTVGATHEKLSPRKEPMKSKLDEEGGTAGLSGPAG